MARPVTVKFTQHQSYCSGVLIADDLAPAPARASDLVLTCGHFFRGRRVEDGIRAASGPMFTSDVVDWANIPGTDLAVVRLAAPAPPRDLPGLAHRRPRPFSACATHGFGGGRRTAVEKIGCVVGWLPFSMSRDLGTVVAHPALTYSAPKVVKGDSGAPVIVDGEVAAVQSLVLDPLGRNLGVATVGMVGPMRRQLAAAVEILRARQRA
ncbi:trypsin-like peptidase domain-containing protein [Corynebacterium guangdongense]|uniref:Trypsin-like peptidase domain-containing protein n=1 Tax=Corynebacterium guangdongense TaxID=1783348 RepID=A0ABU1ZWM0_9CORY|nr:trypsin-like peptidase domain-containing protein [Corynebacterium guangdongense]MDR7329332.1 hypothetical protein [Corynebacterium guangdongense]WJZ17897.1 hypothetical protein CGUA_06635 [Corynebacterium guangdongense]